MRETWVRSSVGKIPWRKKWQPTPVLFPGKSHGRRSLIGYSPWDRKESDTAEQLHFDVTLRTDLCTRLGKERVGRIESGIEAYALPCVKQVARGNLLCNTGGSNPVLCDNRQGRDVVGDGMEIQEGGDISMPVTDSC